MPNNNLFIDSVSNKLPEPRLSVTKQARDLFIQGRNAMQPTPEEARAQGMVELGNGQYFDPTGAMGAGTVARRGAQHAAEALYKTASQYAKEIPLSKIKITSEVLDALNDVKRGVKAKSNLPIHVRLNADGFYEIEDGKHRLAQAWMEGKQAFKAIDNNPMYRQLAEQEEQTLSRQVRSHTRGNSPVRSHRRFVPIRSSK